MELLIVTLVFSVVAVAAHLKDVVGSKPNTAA